MQKPSDLRVADWRWTATSHIANQQVMSNCSRHLAGKWCKAASRTNARCPPPHKPLSGRHRPQLRHHRPRYRASRVACVSLCVHAVATTPEQRLGACVALFPNRISLPRSGDRVSLCHVLFEACSVFTHVTTCILAGSPTVARNIEGFSYFVTSITAPIACGWSNIAGLGSQPLGKRRLCTAYTQFRQCGWWVTEN